MPDIADIADMALYPDEDNMMAMAGPPPARHTRPDPEPKLDLRTREGRAAAGLPPKAKSGGRTAAGGPPVKKAPGRAPASKAREDYRERILGIMQLVALPLAFKSPADGAAVEMHAPNIATALNDLAQVQPEVAAVLDRILKVGPYGMLLTAVVPLLLQIAANHGAVPAGIMGTVPPDVLLAHYMAGMENQVG